MKKPREFWIVPTGEINNWNGEVYDCKQDTGNLPDTTIHVREVLETQESPFDKCSCGHERQHHIYHEGACRPGFQCNSKCESFLK